VCEALELHDFRLASEGRRSENVRACCRDDEDRDVHFGNRVEQVVERWLGPVEIFDQQDDRPLAASSSSRRRNPQKSSVSGNGSSLRPINAERRSITSVCPAPTRALTFATAIASSRRLRPGSPTGALDQRPERDPFPVGKASPRRSIAGPKAPVVSSSKRVLADAGLADHEDTAGGAGRGRFFECAEESFNFADPAHEHLPLSERFVRERIADRDETIGGNRLGLPFEGQRLDGLDLDDTRTSR